MRTEHCTLCRAEIIWVPTKDGERLPLDVPPVRDGNVILRGIYAEYLDGGMLEAIAGLPTAVPRYMIHMATCPAYAKMREERERKNRLIIMPH